MPKYLPEVFVYTERQRSKVCAGKTNEGKYFPVRTEQTRLTRNLLYGFWLGFLYHSKLCFRRGMLLFSFPRNLFILHLVSTS